jgi:hypothetical protein
LWLSSLKHKYNSIILVTQVASYLVEAGNG